MNTKRSEKVNSKLDYLSIYLIYSFDQTKSFLQLKYKRYELNIFDFIYDKIYRNKMNKQFTI